MLADFRVKGEIRDIRPGPVVTLFEFEPSRGTKSARVIALADDVARSMSAASARISVIPGKNALGIELPNAERQTVVLRELLDSEAYRRCDARLPLALGNGIGGEPIVADLARMPHLLVAGTTGSGKSVGINAMILSLLYRMSPEDCRFLMIDPKMLELSAYNGIPHLLAPVVTDPNQAIIALPDQMFYNTGIATYVWILSNKKSPERKGKVQLINGVHLYQKMRKSLGSKRQELGDDDIALRAP